MGENIFSEGLFVLRICAIILSRDDITNDPTELGIIAETAVYKHIKSFYYNEATQIGYYRGGKKDKKIDIFVNSHRFSPIMIEVKYRDQSKIFETDAIVELATEKHPNLVITKQPMDFGEYIYDGKRIYRILAPAFLYMLGMVEYNKNRSEVKGE